MAANIGLSVQVSQRKNFLPSVYLLFATIVLNIWSKQLYIYSI